MTGSNDLPRTFSDLDDRLRSAAGSAETPSITVGVSVGGRVVHRSAFGLSDPIAKNPATVDTPYALASISKPITAAAVMVLAQSGKIDVDKPINAYLGESGISSRPADADAVTIRQVVTHISGLPLHYQFFYEDEEAVRPPFQNTANKFAKTFWVPGERFVYSNLGYGLLDALIERVTGESYSNAMEELIFRPLGMARASIGGNKGGEAVSIGPDGVAYPRYTFDHPGGSAVYSSANDLLSFGQSFLEGMASPILSPSSIREIFRQTFEFGPNRGWGFGWSHTGDRLGLDTWQHDGEMGGVRTVLRLLPTLNAVITVLANGESPLPAKTVDECCGILSQDARKRLIDEREANQCVGSTLEFPDGLAGRWSGSIECGDSFLKLAIDVEENGKAVAIWEGQKYEISEIDFVRGALVGAFDGSIPDPEAARRPHRIHLELVLRDGKLQGAAVAISTNPDGFGGAKGKRLGNALSFWTELIKL